MNKKLILYIFLLLTLGFISGCQKEDSKTMMMATPIAPSITSFPTLTLLRANSADILTFKGTPVNPGFQASATYYLEVDSSGHNFSIPIILYTGGQDTVIKITVNNFDSPLIATYPIGVNSSLEFRIRAVITPDAGSGAVVPIVSLSDATKVVVKPYGPPTLSISPDAHRQGITSPTDNKQYSGFIYSDGLTPFLLTNLDNGKIYGGTVTITTGTSTTGKADLTEGGPAITLPAGGYNMSADLTDLNNIKLTLVDKTLSIIGDGAIDWSTDIKMHWNFSDHSWENIVTLKSGSIKFRTFGDWNNGFNLGYGPSPSLKDLFNGNTSSNITGFIGTYNIHVYTGSTPITATITPVSK